MTNPDYTAIALLLDRSGSMRPLKNDVEGGIATFIEDQSKLPGKCTLTLAQFDDRYEVVHKSLPLDQVPPVVLNPRGSTALLDSWGKLMTEFGEELAALPSNERPGHVIFAVVTDGYENASKEWTREQVFAKTTEQREQWGWDVLFLAAGQDAVAEGARLGVPSHATLDWCADPDGVAVASAAMSNSVTRTRTGRGGGFTQADRDAAKQR